MTIDAVIQKLTLLREELGDCAVSLRINSSLDTRATHISSTTIGENEVFIFAAPYGKEIHTGDNRRNYE